MRLRARVRHLEKHFPPYLKDELTLDVIRRAINGQLSEEEDIHYAPMFRAVVAGHKADDEDFADVPGSAGRATSAGFGDREDVGELDPRRMPGPWGV